MAARGTGSQSIPAQGECQLSDASTVRLHCLTRAHSAVGFGAWRSHAVLPQLLPG